LEVEEHRRLELRFHAMSLRMRNESRPVMDLAYLELRSSIVGGTQVRMNTERP